MHPEIPAQIPSGPAASVPRRSSRTSVMLCTTACRPSLNQQLIDSIISGAPISLWRTPGDTASIMPRLPPEKQLRTLFGSGPVSRLERSRHSQSRHFQWRLDLPVDRLFEPAPKRLTQGWSLFPIVTWRSGLPFDVFANLGEQYYL